MGQKFKGLIFSETEEINNILKEKVKEGYFDTFFKENNYDIDVIKENLESNTKIQEVYALSTENEIDINEMNNFTNEEKEFLKSFELINGGTGNTSFDNISCLSLEKNSIERELFAVGYVIYLDNNVIYKIYSLLNSEK